MTPSGVGRNGKTPSDINVNAAITLERAYAGGKQKIRIGIRTFEVIIPAGIPPGQIIRLAGQGEHGGDLMINIEYKKHPKFELNGLDVIYILTVTPLQAIQGAEITVPTLRCDVILKVPAGSEHGKQLRLKSRGMPSKSNTGDQLVIVEVISPDLEPSPSKENAKRPNGAEFYEDYLIHKTARGENVRSKSELVIANMLHAMGLDYTYEYPLEGNIKSPGIRRPDFAFIRAKGLPILWEHLGMLDNSEYATKWQAKLAWYQANKFKEGVNLFITTDSKADGLDSQEIYAIALKIQKLLKK